jgi:hypothetical protein
MDERSASESSMFENWRFEAERHETVEHLGRPSLRLENGFAVHPDADLLDGIVEFDVAFTPERGFTGATWRMQDDENFEWIWLRPHQSGNPDATQYAPAFNGLAGWQLYHGPRYTVPVSFRFDEWFRVRILFAGRLAEVYVDDMEKPVLFVAGLKREPASGGVGLSASMAPAWFANFSATATESPPIQGRPGSPEQVAPESIRVWSISDPFAEDELDGALATQTWTALESEPSGLTDLARVHGLGGGNTVLARAIVSSDREQTKRLDFGFSDRVTVFLNGRPLYSGADAYQSRDYRFLGSIGWYDSVYLPLREGRNELVMAVSEDFGGWGLQAKLEDLDGLTLEER